MLSFNTYQVSLGSQQQTDNPNTLLAPVGSSHPAGDDEDTIVNKDD